MSALRTVLGGMVACCLTVGSAPAQVSATTLPSAALSPVSLTAATGPDSLLSSPDRAELDGHRPVARPAHMLRYPVTVQAGPPPVQPPMRPNFVPTARWDFRSDGQRWTRAAMSAIASHGNGLEDIIPRDIDAWCPGYAQNPRTMRRAFWVGMMSALAKHESTWRPSAVGGGGLWYGLLQILPDTARRYGCRARTGDALKDPEANLSCAVRIMARTVRRDDAIAVHSGRWRGVAADWGPMTNRGKIAEMAAWTSKQDYCQRVLGPMESPRPKMRPAEEDPTMLARGEIPHPVARMSTMGIREDAAP